MGLDRLRRTHRAQNLKTLETVMKAEQLGRDDVVCIIRGAPETRRDTPVRTHCYGCGINVYVNITVLNFAREKAKQGFIICADCLTKAGLTDAEGHGLFEPTQ